MRDLRRNRYCQKRFRQKEMNDMDRDVVEPAIWRWINGRNGERDRMILSMYLFDGITYEKMLDRIEEAGYPSMTKDNLKKIITKRREQLFRHI